VLRENLPHYERELEKAKGGDNLYPVGRLWAKEHFGTGLRGVQRRRAYPLPAEMVVPPEFDGPYKEGVGGADVWHLPPPEPRPLDPGKVHLGCLSDPLSFGSFLSLSLESSLSLLNPLSLSL
jgi:hypothetical protein